MFQMDPELMKQQVAEAASEKNFTEVSTDDLWRRLLKLLSRVRQILLPSSQKLGTANRRRSSFIS